MAEEQGAQPEASRALPDNSAKRQGRQANGQAGGSASPSSESSKQGAHKGLPMVEGPKLDASDALPSRSVEPVREPLSGPADGLAVKPPAPTAQPWSWRFALLAASIALAAALGSFIGSLSSYGYARFSPAPAPAAVVVAAKSRVPQSLRSERAQLAALRVSVDSATRSASSQFAKIADRLDRLERAQQEPAAKIARLAEAVDRLAKRSTGSPEITGSIASGPLPSTAAPRPPVLPDWAVHGVQSGRALIESRYGGLFDVAPGNIIPGLGRVETIKRQDGHWIVVTPRGLIVSAR